VLPSQRVGELIRSRTPFGVEANVTHVATCLISLSIVIAHNGLDTRGNWNVIVLTAANLRVGSIGVKPAF
jgi:hypothetical protein